MSIYLWTKVSLAGYFDLFKEFQCPWELYKSAEIPTEGLYVCLGQDILALLQKAGIVAKNRTIDSFSEKIIDHESAKFLITYHPSDIEKNYEAKFSIIWKLKQAKRYIETGTFDPPSIETQWVSSLVSFFQKMGTWVSLDLETQGLDPFNPNNYIICLTLSSNGYTCGVYINGAMPSLIFKQLRDLLLSDKVKLQGANLKYDLLWLKVKYGLECSNFVFDTTLVGSLLDENRSNSLKMHGALFTPYGGWDLTSDKSKMSEVPKDQLLTYGSYDVFVQELVAQRFREDIKKEEVLIRKNHGQYGPMNFYQKLVHPVARVFEQIEYRGIDVDVEYLNDLKGKVEGEVEHESKQALDLIPKSLQRKYKDNLSVTRASLLQDFLFTEEGLGLDPLVITKKSGKPSTSYDDHLYKFKDDPKAGEFLKHLKRYSELQKILSTYIDGFKVHIREDGKFHPSVILHRGEFSNGKLGGTVCVTGDTIFTTQRGAINCKSLTNKDKVLTHTGKWQKIENLIVNGIQPIIKITLDTGNTLKTTYNHQYYGIKGWVRADQLQYGDEIHIYQEGEKWKVIPDFPNYEVSSWGQVRNIKTKKLIKQQKTLQGYYTVKLCKAYKKKHFKVHRLVASIFSTLCECEKLETRHLDGVKQNNFLENLSLGTRFENNNDKIIHGQKRHKGSKFTDEELRYIRSVPQTEINNVQMAKKFKCRREDIRDIRKYRCYLWEFGENCFRPQFKVGKIIKIEYMSAEMTYGVQVSTDHSHVTNGIITHNTGRIGWSNPSMMVIPSHTPDADRIRRMFIAPSGYVIVGADLSQAELRLCAHSSQDPVMMQAFKEGKDLHKVTAYNTLKITERAFYKLPIAQQKHYRQVAKCFHPDTEVLTKEGWKKIIDLRQKEEVMQAIPGDFPGVKLEWVVPNEVFTQKNEHTFLYHLKSKNIDLRVTPDHLLLGYGAGKENEAKLVFPDKFNNVRFFINGGSYSEGDLVLDKNLLRQIVCTQADGSYNGMRIRFGFTKQRKIDRFKELFKKGSYHSYVSKQGVSCFILDRETSSEIKKHLNNKQFKWEWLALSSECRETVLDEIIHWDGETNEKLNAILYHNTNKESIDIIQALSHMSNRKTFMKGAVKESENHNTCFTVSIKDHAYSRSGNISCLAIPYTGEVACLSVPSGYVLVRDNGIPVIQKQSQNFGLVYVMGSFGLQLYAEKSYGISFSLEDAEKYYHSFHNTYKKIKPWHKQCIKLAYEYGYRVSLLGRVRHLPQIYSTDKQTQKRAERRAINSTIQGDASDFNLLAVLEISKDPKILPFCTIHDSIYSYVPENYVDTATKKIKEIMEHLPLEQLGCILSVPIVADIKVGYNLGDLHDV